MSLDLSVFNQEQIKKIRDAVNEAVKAKVEIENQKSIIKDISTQIKEDLEIATAEFNTLVNVVFKDNLDELQGEIDTLSNNLQVLYPNVN